MIVADSHLPLWAKLAIIMPLLAVIVPFLGYIMWTLWRLEHPAPKREDPELERRVHAIEYELAKAGVVKFIPRGSLEAEVIRAREKSARPSNFPEKKDGPGSSS